MIVARLRTLTHCCTVIVVFTAAVEMIVARLRVLENKENNDFYGDSLSMKRVNDYIEEIVERGYAKEFSQYLVHDFLEQVYKQMFGIWGDGEWEKYIDAVLFVAQAQ